MSVNFAGVKIAKHALGKYIIVAACLLHIMWAGILCFDVRAGNSTPVSIFFAIFDYRIIVIVVFLSVAALSFLFLDFRMRQFVPTRWLSLLLIPQQLTLLLSAGIGIQATIVQEYADGTVRSWAHIACDQAPIVVIAILYTIAVLETLDPPKK